MTSGDSTSYTWTAAGWVQMGEGKVPISPLLVADSWRGSGGRVAAFDAHRRRFEESVASVLAADPLTNGVSGAALLTGPQPTGPQLDTERFDTERFDTKWTAFWHGVAATVQRAHRDSGNPELFPRVSLRSQGSATAINESNVLETSEVPSISGEDAAPSSAITHRPDILSLVLDVRPAPPIRRVTRLLYTPIPDPRHKPRIKGPDLARLSEARELAMAQGFDDLLLCDNDGTILETCTGNLMWWDGHVAVFPRRQTQLLPGVTAEQVRLRLDQIGTPLRFADVSVSDLAGHAVWFLNSLHGVSPVVTLSNRGEDVPLARHPHEDEWREWWLVNRHRPPSPTTPKTADTRVK